MNELKIGDKVFWEYKFMFWKFYSTGLVNYVGEHYVLVDDIVWESHHYMMKYCKTIKKDRVKHL